MREQLARGVALFVAVVTVSLALAFAWLQNPPDAGSARDVPAPASPAPPPALIEAGRAVYEAQGCSVCHSIAGVGNPRNPLDGVGARLTPDEIRQWIVGAAALEGRLPARVFRIKQDYQALPDADLAALVAYMRSLPR